MAEPKAGEQYTYTGEKFGNDPGAVYPGTVVTVREVVPADTSGAHDASEDSVVLEFFTRGQVVTEVREESFMRPEIQTAPDGNPLVDSNGELVIRAVRRRRAVPVFGEGDVPQVFSVGVDRFKADFQKGAN